MSNLGCFSRLTVDAFVPGYFLGQSLHCKNLNPLLSNQLKPVNQAAFSCLVGAIGATIGIFRSRQYPMTGRNCLRAVGMVAGFFTLSMFANYCLQASEIQKICHQCFEGRAYLVLKSSSR